MDFVKDAIDNVLKIGDYVVCALGANRNQNNSSLTICKVTNIKGSRAYIETANHVVTPYEKMPTKHKQYYWDKNYRVYDVSDEEGRWKFGRQLCKVSDVTLQYYN